MAKVGGKPGTPLSVKYKVKLSCEEKESDTLAEEKDELDRWEENFFLAQFQVESEAYRYTKLSNGKY